MNKLLLEFKYLKKYDDEIFKFAKYPGIIKHKYVISSYGRLFSYISLEEKKIHYDKDGYKFSSITILKNGKHVNKNIAIHRLVAYTFHKKPEGCDVVNHLDGNKTNNHYTNLEWTTPLGNTRHAILNRLQINSGVNSPRSKYSEELIRKICKMFEDGYGSYEIYKEVTGHDKVIDKSIYMLIHRIKENITQCEIRSEYDIPNVIDSKIHPKFSKSDEIKITEMIMNGYSNTDIIKEFGGKGYMDKKGRRIGDKIYHIKNKMRERSTTIENIS